MKKIMLLFALVILMHQGVFSQETEIQEPIKQKTVKQEKSFTIQTNPVLLLVDFIYFGVENIYDSRFCMMDLEGQYKINNTLSVALSFYFYTLYDGYYDYDSYSDSYTGATVYSINFKPALIVKPTKTGLGGFYIGMFPIIGFRTDRSDYEGVSTELGFGFNTGYKWIFKNGFTMQLGGGFSKLFHLPRPVDYYDYNNPFSGDGSLNLPNFNWHIVDFKLGYSF